MNIYLAKDRGFCMGVERSINMAEQARKDLDGSITILNEIVHNNSVVNSLERKGIKRTTDLDAVSDGTLIISAHGVSPSVIDKAKNKGLTVINSTCPLVKVLHKSAEYFIKRGYTIIVHGDPKHDEMKGVRGHNPDKIHVLKEIRSLDDLPEIDGKVALISQSTQSLEFFDKAAKLVEQKYDDVKIKNTICEATRKRQMAIIDLAPTVDLVIVVGSPTSANSKRLMSMSIKKGTEAHLIDSLNDLKPEWFKEVKNIGVTAGASTPDDIVGKVVSRIKEIGFESGAGEVNIFDDKDD